MIALDTNLLVYAHREDSPHHAVASQVVADLARGRAPWGLPWPCLHEFLAIVTHPRIYRPPTPVATAVEAVRALIAAPTVQVLSEAPDHARILADLLTASGVAGPKVHDARVAAICVGHGVRELWSAGRDFTWFPQVRVVNPLTGGGPGGSGSVA